MLCITGTYGEANVPYTFFEPLNLILKDYNIGNSNDQTHLHFEALQKMSGGAIG